MKQTILFTLFAAFSFSVANAQVPSYVPNDGLVGWWPFNGDAADESGNGNDGTVVGATLTTDRNGVENAAYSFDGVNDYAYTNSEIGNFELQDFTISAWINDNNDNNIGSVVAKRFSNSYGNFISMDWTDGPQIQINENNASDYYLYTSSVAFSNTWANYVLIRENSVIRMFLNGNLLHELNPGYVHNINNSADLSFGARSYSGTYGDFLNAKIDDIGIWNRALTEEEIQLLYTGCTIEPTAIVGENAPLNFTTSTYFCNDNPGSSYTWTVTNGVISSGQGTNSIVVLWGNEGQGTVSIIETNAEGCDGPVASFVVDVQCSSNITSIDGNINPVILSPIAYTVNGPADSEYTWSVTNGVIASGQGTNSVNVIWAAEGEGTLSVIETTSTGCESPVVTITTNATVTSVPEITHSQIHIYPNPVSDQLTIRTDQILHNEHYKLFDASGKIVIQGKINTTTNTINTQSLSNGLYFLMINNTVEKVEKRTGE